MYGCWTDKVKTIYPPTLARVWVDVGMGRGVGRGGGGEQTYEEKIVPK